tara:strand:+ start:143 stop:715 length:573 start_codon:yes stop_codon:yes gene_type:complete
MIKIIHRVNTADELKQIPNDYGVEIDIRGFKDKLILTHEFGEKGYDFNDYINLYSHNLLVANIKESGIENEVITKLNKKNISNYFLLDVEFPYILQNHKEHGEKLSLRFSRFEGIETIRNFIGKVKWVWIDTYDDFKLNDETTDVLSKFNLCLVSPSRWGHPNKIEFYLDKFRKSGLKIDGIMIEEEESL